MMPDFNIADSSTWPAVLTVDQVAEIYRRPVGGVRKACQQHRFVPAPFQTHPYRFRKTDVVRDVEGGRAALRRVS
jgi:hypothetical protein